MNNVRNWYISMKNYRYCANYKIDFKNQKIFELINFDSKQLIELAKNSPLLERNLEYFETIFDETTNLNLKEIEKRIFYNNYHYRKNKTNKKNFLISASDDNIHYLVDDNFLNNFFKYKETHYNDNDYSITHIYLDNKNETYYHTKIYSMEGYCNKKNIIEIENNINI